MEVEGVHVVTRAHTSFEHDVGIGTWLASMWSVTVPMRFGWQKRSPLGNSRRNGRSRSGLGPSLNALHTE